MREQEKTSEIKVGHAISSVMKEDKVRARATTPESPPLPPTLIINRKVVLWELELGVIASEPQPFRIRKCP